MSGPLLLALPQAGRLRGFTSTRQGGVSPAPYASLNLGLNTDDAAAAVIANREAALAAAGAPAGRTAYLCQVHGDAIVEAAEKDAGRGSRDWAQGLPACDAAFTRMPALPLAIGHADCLAVVLADPEAGLLGLAHAGWRGALAQLPGKLARRLLAEGARAERLQALLSPCLGPQNLELGEEQWRLFLAADAQAGHYCSRLQRGTSSWIFGPAPGANWRSPAWRPKPSRARRSTPWAIQSSFTAIGAIKGGPDGC